MKRKTFDKWLILKRHDSQHFTSRDSHSRRGPLRIGPLKPLPADLSHVGRFTKFATEPSRRSGSNSNNRVTRDHPGKHHWSGRFRHDACCLRSRERGCPSCVSEAPSTPVDRSRICRRHWRCGWRGRPHWISFLLPGEGTSRYRAVQCSSTGSTESDLPHFGRRTKGLSRKRIPNPADV